MRRYLRITRGGVSNVISVVIILAVAVSVAIIVVFWEIIIAFWMTGSTGLSMKCERLEITDAYSDWCSNYSVWVVVLHVVNMGSSDATIDGVFINGKPFNSLVGLSMHNLGYVYGRVTVTADDVVNNSEVAGVEVYSFDDGKWNITIDKAYPIDDDGFKELDLKDGVPLKAGYTATLIILMNGPGASSYGATEVPFKHGSSIEVKIHTAIGKEYPIVVELP